MLELACKDLVGDALPHISVLGPFAWGEARQRQALHVFGYLSSTRRGKLDLQRGPLPLPRYGQDGK